MVMTTGTKVKTKCALIVSQQLQINIPNVHNQKIMLYIEKMAFISSKSLQEGELTVTYNVVFPRTSTSQFLYIFDMFECTQRLLGQFTCYSH